MAALIRVSNIVHVTDQYRELEMAKCGSIASTLKPLHVPAFPAARCIPYCYCDETYYPYGNSPMADFLCYYDWKETGSEQVNPSILSLGCGDIRFCVATLVKYFYLGCSTKLEGIKFYLNDRCDSIHARNVMFLHILQKNAGNPPKSWIPSLWGIWYNHELLPQHVDVLQDAVTDLLSLSESADKWAKSAASICSLCYFEEDTLSEMRSIWKIWLKRLSGKQHTTIQFVKNERDKCPIRASYINHPRVALLFVSLHKQYQDHVLDAMSADLQAYLKHGSAFAETVGSFAEISTQRVLNPTFFEKNNTYNMSCFLSPYFSFKPMFCSERNMLKEGLFVNKRALEIHPLLGNSVEQFTIFLSVAAGILISRHDKNIKFYFNNLDAVVYCQKLSKLGSKFDCIDSSNLIDHLSPLVLVIAAMPLLREGGLMLSSAMMIRNVAPSVEQYLHKTFGFDPALLPTLFGITYSFGEAIHGVIPQIIWKRDGKAQPLKIDCLSSRPDIVQALVGLTKVTNSDEKLFREFRMCAETAVLSYCLFASMLYFDAPIDSHQFWDSLCLHLRQEDELQKYLLHIQTQAFLHNLHLHLVISGDQCSLCMQQSPPIEQYELLLPVAINPILNGSLRARIRDPDGTIQYEINCLAYRTIDENCAAVNFFWPRFCKHDLISLESSKGCFVLPTPAAVGLQVFSYSFQQVHKCTTPDTHAFKGIAVADSLGVMGCSSCGKQGSILKHCPCHLVAYCNDTCQRIDWPVHKRRHKAAGISK